MADAFLFPPSLSISVPHPENGDEFVHPSLAGVSLPHPKPPLRHLQAPPRPGVAIGNYVLDLLLLHRNGFFHGPYLSGSDCFLQPTLNKFISLGRPAWKEAREVIEKLLSADEPSLQDNDHLKESVLVPMSEVEMLLPVEIGDFTDFFASKHHAKACGTIFGFNSPENPVNLNWLSLPIAYHVHASSVVVSGTDIVHPRGQGPPVGDSTPYFGPSRKLDFKLEMAAIVGPGNELGNPIDIDEAKDHIFGLVLLNDWTGRFIFSLNSVYLF